MALCPDCSQVIPCHCHLTPAAEVRPGVYQTTEPHPQAVGEQRALGYAAAAAKEADRG